MQRNQKISINSQNVYTKCYFPSVKMNKIPSNVFHFHQNRERKQDCRRQQENFLTSSMNFVKFTNFGRQNRIKKMKCKIPAEWLKGLNSNLIKCFRWWKSLIKHIWTFYSGENWKQFFLNANINVIDPVTFFSAYFVGFNLKGKKCTENEEANAGELCKL